MKKKLIQSIIAPLLLLFLSQTTLHAADINAGATTWYTAWDFDWGGLSSVRYDPGFLYGPVLSFTMTPDLNLSFVYLYGKFEQSVNGSGNGTVSRSDGDLTLNYRLNGYFKLFTGAKYLHTAFSTGEHRAAGPGAGLSSIFPMGDSFFLLGNFSGMYLWGKENSSYYNVETHEYGVNASISLAYCIPSSSTTISLGGRYQQVKIIYEPVIPLYMVFNSTSRFYGVTLSAVYNFNI